MNKFNKRRITKSEIDQPPRCFDDIMPKKLIQRSEVEKAVKQYLKAGGKIKLITIEEIQSRSMDDILNHISV